MRSFSVAAPASTLLPRLLSFLLFLIMAGGVAQNAHAQHPTAVTSILNGEATPDTTLETNYNGSLLLPGQFISTTSTANDSIPVKGAGTRMMWYPAKAAFRAGRLQSLPSTADKWDAANIGDHSVAFGLNTEASGESSVAMGDETEATAVNATAMGNATDATAENATAMGNVTEAIADNATAMGNVTEAIADNATAMGDRTDATAENATAMGDFTEATGGAATAMGENTRAATDSSLSIGYCNDANTSPDNSLFVVGNGTDGGFSCDSRSDALVLDQSGNISIDGVFESGPTNSLFAGQFEGTANGDAFDDPGKQVVLIENRADDESFANENKANVLALQGGPTGAPGTDVNYISFYDGDGDSRGAIQGNGNGGTEFKSSGSDYAEELPVAEDAAVPQETDLVGVRGGQISLDTEGADRVMIASRAPAVRGNVTTATQSDDDRRVAVAFVGQVPAQVRGTVEVGDLIVASGQDDGSARAVAPSAYRRSKHGPIAGQAWTAKSSEDIGEVTVAVGLGRSGAVAEQLQAQRQRNQQQEQRINNLENRLTALEAKVSADKPALASLGGFWGLTLLVGLGLGGLIGSFFWRRRPEEYQ